MNSLTQIVLIGAILIVVLVAIVKKVPISLRGGPVQVDVSKAIKDIQENVDKINKAVNNTPRNTPPLVSRVEQLENVSYWTADALHKIALHVGLVLVEPPDRRISNVKKNLESEQ